MYLRELVGVILRLLSNTFERWWQRGRVKKKSHLTAVFKKGMMEETKGQSVLSLVWDGYGADPYGKPSPAIWKGRRWLGVARTDLQVQIMPEHPDTLLWRGEGSADKVRSTDAVNLDFRRSFNMVC